LQAIGIQNSSTFGALLTLHDQKNKRKYLAKLVRKAKDTLTLLHIEPHKNLLTVRDVYTWIDDEHDEEVFVIVAERVVHDFASEINNRLTLSAKEPDSKLYFLRD
jgi:hypothetical protein